MTDKYSEAYLDEKFRSQEELMDAHFAAIVTTLKSVDEQTKKTNGSVAKANIEIENLKLWRTGLTYAYTVALLFIIPVLALSLYKIWNQPPALTEEQVQAAMSAAIYEAIHNQ